MKLKLVLGLAVFAVGLFGALAAPSPADEGVPADEIEVPAPAPPRTASDPAVAPAPSDPPADEPAEDLWSFRLGVYGWLPNLKGTAIIEDTPIHFDITHGQVGQFIFHNLKGNFGFYGEARRDRFAAQLDIFYMKLSNISLNDVNKGPVHLPDGWNLPLAINQHYTIALFTPSISYTAFETDLDLGPFDHLRIEPKVGFRYMYLKADVRVVDSLILEEIGRKVFRARENFWEPLPLGLEVELGFLENWSLLASVMLGGWGMGDAKKTTDGVGDLLLKYRISKHFTAEAGVRWEDMYMKGDDYEYLQLHNLWGPRAQVTWNF